MRSLYAVIVAGFLIGGTMISFVAVRPAYMVWRNAMNSTIYDTGDADAITSWNNTRGTTDTLYWWIPGGMGLFYIIWVWLIAQQKEYVTGGAFS